MGSREGLVQVQVNDIKAHVAGTGHACDRIQVCPIVIEQAPCRVNFLGNFLNVGFEQAHRVGVGEHQRCSTIIQQRF